MRRQAHQSTFETLWRDTKPDLRQERISVPVYRVQLVRESSRHMLPVVEDMEDAAKILSEYLAHEDREHLAVLLLDVKNRVLGIHTAGIGTLQAALVEPREIFKAAILANAAGIVVGHNHPSGDPTPSTEDYIVTERLSKAGELLGIDLLDHIVLGEFGSHVSIRQWGGFPTPGLVERSSPGLGR